MGKTSKLLYLQLYTCHSFIAFAITTSLHNADPSTWPPGRSVRLHLPHSGSGWTLVGWQGGRLGGISAGWQGVYVIDCNMTVWDSNQRSLDLFTTYLIMYIQGLEEVYEFQK